jgi:predicted ATPase
MTAVRRDLPTGDVTLVFTDIEGSTALLHELGASEYASVLAEHRRLLRETFNRHGGIEVDTQGDAFFVAFPTAHGAVLAASEAQEALAPGRVRVRMGVHTGRPHATDEGYVGDDVNKGARVAAVAHGGQVVLTRETRDLVDVRVTDLGEHRVKDFRDPVWIFQLGSEHFPPLKTISNTNLPRPASSFVGRRRELGDVLSLVQEARLVTLTGPGGTGKTRLAVEAAASVVPEFANGVFWIGLAPVRDAGVVVQTIAQTVGAKDGLADHIGERQMLLLLDNFEQVVGAAPEVATLLEACPNLRIVCTSRERLRVRGEVEYAVLPLEAEEAVALFSARSGSAPEDTILELCARLDNLPLAVELAAARAGVLSPDQILERLGQRLDILRGGRDAEARQQTLRATIAWSHELLDESERGLFARLSVFTGGCTLEAAEEVAEAELDPLASLVDKSLVRRTGERFWMLETIREYAAERLGESARRGDIRRRHAEYYLALAEENEPAARNHSRAALDVLEGEQDNFRAAIDWYETTGETQEVLRLAASLSHVWGIRGYFEEAQRQLDRALANDPARTASRAKALTAAADLALVTDSRSKQRVEEALSIFRELEDTAGTAEALLVLGSIYEGEWEKARDLWAEAARLFEKAGDRYATVFAKRLLAWSYSELGERESARALHARNLEEARSIGAAHLEAHSLEALAHLLVGDGRAQDAFPLIERAYRIHANLGDPFREAISVGRFAAATAGLGQPRLAATLLSCSRTLLEEMGAAPKWVMEMNDETRTVIQAALDNAAFAEAWEKGKTLSDTEAVELALACFEEDDDLLQPT